MEGGPTRLLERVRAVLVQRGWLARVPLVRRLRRHVLQEWVFSFSACQRSEAYRRNRGLQLRVLRHRLIYQRPHMGGECLCVPIGSLSEHSCQSCVVSSSCIVLVRLDAFCEHSHAFMTRSLVCSWRDNLFSSKVSQPSQATRASGNTDTS